MKKLILNKLFLYIFAPIIIFLIIVGSIIIYTRDISNSINYTLTILQSLALLIGGFWAYFKFGWEKRAESIIELKGVLMELREFHNMRASEYRLHGNFMNYKLSMINEYNIFLKKMHLSYYISPELRNRIFNTFWLTCGNDTNEENLDKQWGKFEKELEEIYIEFDKIINV